MKTSGALISESVNNVRTVKALNLQDQFVNEYDKSLGGFVNIGRKRSHTSGILYGLGQFGANVVYAVCFYFGAMFVKDFDLDFYFGAIFVKDFDLDFKDMLTAIFAIAFGAAGAGQAGTFAPDFKAARQSSKDIFALLDQESEINPQDVTGLILPASKREGKIEFRDIEFVYPSRAEKVLNGVTFQVLPGQSCALVGPSGCGKSTTIQLLLRFYEPMAGSIRVDNVSINEINIQSLRDMISLVAQEPVLFNTTIAENIRYGYPEATDEEIREAAIQANALEFIEKTASAGENRDGESNFGFARVVGPRGGKLSGGQKQRVAIARAIIRSPKILLLDEATSALDAESEKIVQNALDKVMKGKSTIIHHCPSLEFYQRL